MCQRDSEDRTPSTKVGGSPFSNASRSCTGSPRKAAACTFLPRCVSCTGDVRAAGVSVRSFLQTRDEMTLGADTGLLNRCRWAMPC